MYIIDSLIYLLCYDSKATIIFTLIQKKKPPKGMRGNELEENLNSSYRMSVVQQIENLTLSIKKHIKTNNRKMYKLCL